MIYHFRFLRNKDYVHKVSFRSRVHYISYTSKSIWNRCYIYHLYYLFGSICNEKYFYFYTWTSPWIAGESIKPSVQGKIPHRSLMYTFSCSLTYCFSIFSVTATKSCLAFSYSNASIVPIPWSWLVLLPVLIRLYYIIRRYNETVKWISHKRWIE